MRYRLRIVPLIIAANIVVFILWYLNGGTNSLWMLDNFSVSYESLVQGRYWTLVTAEFSHNWILHLLINMFVLRSFGSLLESVLGSFRFLWFYLLASVSASLMHCYLSALYLNEPSMPAVGASGAIAGLVLVFSLLFPKEKILLFGLLPLPALIGALAFIVLDLWGLMAQAGGGGLPIGHGAHLGGAFFGIFYWLVVLRRRRIHY
jgi:membrane associated rhomboid family serine protease